MHQRWAIIIVIVTTLECHWATSRMASLSCGFLRQILVGDCRQSTVSFAVWYLGVSGWRHVCPPGVSSQIGRHRLISGRVSGNKTCQWRDDISTQKLTTLLNITAHFFSVRCQPGKPATPPLRSISATRIEQAYLCTSRKHRQVLIVSENQSRTWR